jgi:hypothetical protein
MGSGGDLACLPFLRLPCLRRRGDLGELRPHPDPNLPRSNADSVPAGRKSRLTVRKVPRERRRPIMRTQVHHAGRLSHIPGPASRHMASARTAKERATYRQRVAGATGTVTPLGQQRPGQVAERSARRTVRSGGDSRAPCRAWSAARRGHPRDAEVGSEGKARRGPRGGTKRSGC